MIEAFLNPILPVFALFGVGFLLGITGKYSVDEARGINRFAIQIAVPVLVFGILVRSKISEFDLHLMGNYFAVEVAIYLAVFLLARFLFVRPLGEAIVLGMAASFSNHVFYVLPIAVELYGPAAAGPIGAIITVDAVFIFGATVILMEFLTAEAPSRSALAGQIVKNPSLIAIALGAFVLTFSIPMHPGILTFVQFTGAAAAPACLFALGIILAKSDAFKFDWFAGLLSVISLVLVPALLFGANMVAGLDAKPAAWYYILVAAGPVGAMPFVIALRYGVETATITKAIVYSTLASLFTLAWLA